MRTPRIIAAHLINDLSGSPLVFSQALSALEQAGHDVHLFTSTPTGKGFLSNLPGVENHTIFYRWSNSKFLTLACYLANQVILFVRLLIFLRAGDLVYVNSILPFGAALAARTRGCPVIYHIHEVSIRPEMLKKFLLAMVNALATECIYVSQYTRTHTGVAVPGRVIYNALSGDFTASALRNAAKPKQFTVLMACSLRIYKGVNIFLDCANRMPAINFELVLNASQLQINAFFKSSKVPDNLRLYPAQTNMQSFYARASVVLNLSLAYQWIETFGMTILEAMHYRRPVIIPPCGGITELVQDGVNGFWIDSSEVEKIVSALELLSSNTALYDTMSKASAAAANRFSQDTFHAAIIDAVSDTRKVMVPHPASYRSLDFKKKFL